MILADYIRPGPRDAEKTINAPLSVHSRDDVAEAVDRLELGTGCGYLSGIVNGTTPVTSD